MPMNKLLRVTTYDTRLRLQQNQNPMHHQLAGAGVHERTAHWPRRKRMYQYVTSRCGRSDTLGSYYSQSMTPNDVVSFDRCRLHTVAEDTLGKLCSQGTLLVCLGVWRALIISPSDPDDLIFPRATTRVGPKYQAPIPAKDGARDPGWRHFHFLL